VSRNGGAGRAPQFVHRPHRWHARGRNLWRSFGYVRRRNFIPYLLVGVVTAFAGLGAALGLAQNNPAPASVHSSFGGLKFSFPAGWKVLKHEVGLSSQSNSILFASNQPLHFYCGNLIVPQGTIRNCTGPLTRLHRNSALVQWGAMGDPFPAAEVLGTGKTTTIGGQRAKVTITSSDQCYAALHTLGPISDEDIQENVGSQENIFAVIAERSPSNYLTFDACIRGPDIAGVRRSLMTSLRSTRIADS
jgi:hypothetical protein